jgi:hypothetical protein
VGARGDRAAALRQHPADRLAPELSTIDHVVTMLVDETSRAWRWAVEIRREIRLDMRVI